MDSVLSGNTFIVFAYNLSFFIKIIRFYLIEALPPLMIDDRLVING